MKTFSMLVEEDVNCATVSFTSNLVVSPRGGVYFPGSILAWHEDNSRLDSFSGSLSRKSVVSIAIDPDDTMFIDAKFVAQLATVRPGLNFNALDLVGTTFNSLERRYKQLSDQHSFKFYGSVKIIINILDAAGNVIQASENKVDIKQPADFLNVLHFIRVSNAECEKYQSSDHLGIDRISSPLKF